MLSGTACHMSKPSGERRDTEKCDRVSMCRITKISFQSEILLSAFSGMAVIIHSFPHTWSILKFLPFRGLNVNCSEKATEILMMNECITFQTDSLWNLITLPEMQPERQSWSYIDGRPHWWPCKAMVHKIPANSGRLIPHLNNTSYVDLHALLSLPSAPGRQPHPPVRGWTVHRQMKPSPRVSAQSPSETSCCMGPRASQGFPPKFSAREEVTLNGKPYKVSSYNYSLNYFLLMNEVLPGEKINLITIQYWLRSVCLNWQNLKKQSNVTHIS